MCLPHPDHALLTASFQGCDQVVPRLIWRRPWPLEFPPACDEEDLTDSQDPIEGDPSVLYRGIWVEFENLASVQLQAQGRPPPSQAQIGRAATIESSVHRSPLAPPTKGRQGEFSQAYCGLNAQMAGFTRQLRRVQAFKQAMTRASSAPQAVEARASFWQAVYKAPLSLHVFR